MKKTFDCVKMKDECAKKVRARIGNATIRQEVEFWKKCGDSSRTLRKSGRL